MYSSTLLSTSALEGGEGSASRPGRTLPPAKTRYPLYRRLVGPQGRSGRENLAPTGIRSPDRPARRQSLYRLRYPAHYIYMCIKILIYITNASACFGASALSSGSFDIAFVKVIKY